MDFYSLGRVFSGQGEQVITVCDNQLQEQVLTYLQKRFGIEPSVFDGFAFFEGTNGRVYLGPRAVSDLSLAKSIGILIARVQKGIKPTSHLFQVFGRSVSRNTVSLIRQQAVAYMKGNPVMLLTEQFDQAQPGWVMLSFRGEPLGCGLLKDKSVQSVLPKGYRLSVKHL